MLWYRRVNLVKGFGEFVRHGSVWIIFVHCFIVVERLKSTEKENLIHKT